MEPLRSVKDEDCLTRCYPQYTEYLHPMFLKDTIDNQSSCAIFPVAKENGTGMVFTRHCKLEHNNEFKIPDQNIFSMTGFNISSNTFLKIVYNIHNFDDSIKWIDINSTVPFDTIKRIHDCSWAAHGYKTSYLSESVYEHYYNLCNKYWIKEYLEKYKKIFPDTKDIKDKFKATMSYIFFISMIKDYVKKNRDNWDSIESHYDNLKQYIFERMIKFI